MNSFVGLPPYFMIGTWIQGLDFDNYLFIPVYTVRRACVWVFSQATASAERIVLRRRIPWRMASRLIFLAECRSDIVSPREKSFVAGWP